MGRTVTRRRSPPPAAGIRKALEERLARLRLRVVKRDREAEVLRYLEREVWPSVPKGRRARDPRQLGHRGDRPARALVRGPRAQADAGGGAGAGRADPGRDGNRPHDAATIAYGEEHWREAVTAYERFGRGRHEAQLNFGDCMAYAVAKLAGEPLPCTGRDFARTDLTLA